MPEVCGFETLRAHPHFRPSPVSRVPAMQRSQFISQSAASSNHPLAAVQSGLAISMYGYGLAAKRVAATEGLTPRSARACITFRARSSRALSRPRPARSATTTPRSASSPSLDNHWGLRPKQKFDVRAQLAVGSQHLMEVADVSYLHTADLVATDGRSCCNGSIMVHESASLDSTLVAQLTAHTRLHVVDSCWLDDHTKRALIVVEGDDEPLGWATAITSDGIPLIYLFARPLYEVAKQPLKYLSRCATTLSRPASSGGSLLLAHGFMSLRRGKRAMGPSVFVLSSLVRMTRPDG